MTYEARRKAFNEITDLKRLSSKQADVDYARKVVISVLIGLATLIALRNLPVHVPFLIALLLSCLAGYWFALWQYDRWVRPKSWRMQLDQALTRYEPADLVAFTALQEDTRQLSRLRDEAFEQWKDMEQVALSHQSGITAGEWHFAQQRA